MEGKERVKRATCPFLWWKTRRKGRVGEQGHKKFMRSFIRLFRLDFRSLVKDLCYFSSLKGSHHLRFTHMLKLRKSGPHLCFITEKLVSFTQYAIRITFHVSRLNPQTLHQGTQIGAIHPQHVRRPGPVAAALPQRIFNQPPLKPGHRP